MNTEEQDNAVDIFDEYAYKPGQEVLIDAGFLIGVLSFCRRVDDSQPEIAVPTRYAKDVRVVTNKDTGEVVRVDTDWSVYPTKESFANTAFDIKSAVPIMTQLGLFSFQLQNALYGFHEKNINNGIAIKVKKDVATNS